MGLFKKQPKPEFVEGFRRLAANLRAMETSRRLRMVLVMSAYPRDGRTTTVLNLGMALAEGNSSVMLVDTDYRQPNLCKLLDLETECKLYSQQQILEAPGMETSVENVRLLPAVPVPRNGPIPPLAPLVKGLSGINGIDYTIFDSPSCIKYADAFQLAPIVDGVIYVVRNRRQDNEAQRRIRRQLDHIGANLLGVVFNKK